MEFAANRSFFFGADDSYSQIAEGRSFFMPGKRRFMIEAQPLIFSSTTLFGMATLFPFRSHTPPLPGSLFISFYYRQRENNGK